MKLIDGVFRLSHKERDRLRDLKGRMGENGKVTFPVPAEVPQGQGFKIGSPYFSDRHDPLCLVRLADIKTVRSTRQFTVRIGDLPL